MSSCTITKRVHRSGYYISSNKNVKATKGKVETKTFAIEAKVDSTLVANHNKAEKTEIAINKKSDVFQNEKAKVKVQKAPVVIEKKKFSKNFIVNKFSKTKPQQIETKTNDETKVTNGFGLASFILGILSFVTLGLTGLFAISFGLKAMKQHKMNPDKYKNRWMPILGYILGIITTFVMSFWFLIAALWNSNIFMLILAIALFIFAIVSLVKIL